MWKKFDIYRTETIRHNVFAVDFVEDVITCLVTLSIGGDRVKVSLRINEADEVTVEPFSREPDCDEHWWYGYPDEETLVDLIVKLVRDPR